MNKVSKGAKIRNRLHSIDVPTYEKAMYSNICIVHVYSIFGIVKRYTCIRVGYNFDIMRQSACLVLNSITVYNYGFLFNCTTVGQASDSITALM